MPTYEYACTSCGHRFEAHQSFSDEALTTCPECGEPLRKVFGSVGIVLKGPGFYRTDSRNGSSASRSTKDAGDKATASSGDGPSSTTSPASGASESVGTSGSSGTPSKPSSSSGSAGGSASSAGSATKTAAS